MGAGEVFNPATAAIDFFHYMGWAWELKKANPELVKNRIQKHGDQKYSYKLGSALYEWIPGLASMFAPILVSRWILLL